ncbi:Rz1 family lipoprotein [Yersinia pseudotuberculosis]|uniref:Rz1 family lipoprotein n=1 Tax=Yersinia pseudotuberculosis TaxID=633 RepID=UPI001D051934|nr:Rz1 family lipoprotein [Yersinia pseudotuberculosis]
MALSGCSSTPHVQNQCPKPPAPPASLMMPAPDLLTPLNGIISVSASVSELPQCYRLFPTAHLEH